MTVRSFYITSVESRLRAGFSFVILVTLALLLSGCATQSYHYESTSSFPIRDRAKSETKGQITISASVPGEAEAQAIFGIPIYDRGIQPVWLNIENNSEERVRFAPTGVDPDYFSPPEVASLLVSAKNGLIVHGLTGCAGLILRETVPFVSRLRFRRALPVSGR